MPGKATNVTEKLKNLNVGAEHAETELFQAIYHDLKRLAALQIRGDCDRLRVSPTELVNETYLTVWRRNLSRYEWKNSHHFFNFAIRAMKRCLIDLSRRASAEKRDHRPTPAEFAENATESGLSLEELITIKKALERLQNENPAAGKVARCMFYDGYTGEETAQYLTLSQATVWRHCRFIKAFLLTELNPPSKPKKL